MAAIRACSYLTLKDPGHYESGRRYMVFVMYGVVLLIGFIAVAVAAMKDTRLAKAAANPKSK